MWKKWNHHQILKWGMSNLWTWVVMRESDRQTQPGGLFPFTRMHLPYPQAHLAIEKRGRATTVSVTKNHSLVSSRTHNHTNVANAQQLRLATFSQPTFFSRRPSLPRQRAGKLQLTHLFSQSHTDKQTIVELALARRLL